MIILLSAPEKSSSSFTVKRYRPFGNFNSWVSMSTSYRLYVSLFIHSSLDDGQFSFKFDFFKEKSIVGARQTQIFFFFMGNNGFNCLEVRGPLGRKYQADKQEQSNAAARCILDLHSRIP